MKKLILLLLTVPVVYSGCGKNKNDGSQQKNGIELQQNPIIKLTEFKNGRWISTIDSLSGIEIRNDKWIMFYKAGETESSSIYDFKIRGENIKGSDTENKILEYLTLTNDFNILEYYIIDYSDELLSLSFIGRGNTLNYKPEKYYEEYTEYKFSAKKGLNVREYPNVKSNIKFKLNYGQQVYLESKTGIKLTIIDTDKKTGKKNIEGEWVKIINYKTEDFDDSIPEHRMASSTIYYLGEDLYNGTTKNPKVKLSSVGYVFDGFLEEKSKLLKQGTWIYYSESGFKAKEEYYKIVKDKNPHDGSPIIFDYPSKMIQYYQDGSTIRRKRIEEKGVIKYPDGSWDIDSEITDETFFRNGKIECSELNGYFDYYKECWDENGNLLDDI